MSTRNPHTNPAQRFEWFTIEAADAEARAERYQHDESLTEFARRGLVQYCTNRARGLRAAATRLARAEGWLS